MDSLARSAETPAPAQARKRRHPTEEVKPRRSSRARGAQSHYASFLSAGKQINTLKDGSCLLESVLASSSLFRDSSWTDKQVIKAFARGFLAQCCSPGSTERKVVFKLPRFSGQNCTKKAPFLQADMLHHLVHLLRRPIVCFTPLEHQATVQAEIFLGDCILSCTADEMLQHWATVETWALCVVLSNEHFNAIATSATAEIPFAESALCTGPTLEARMQAALNKGLNYTPPSFVLPAHCHSDILGQSHIVKFGWRPYLP